MKTQRAKLREYLSDVFALTIFGKLTRQKRIGAWKKHVENFNKIASGDALHPLLGTTRIEFLGGHLDILDRKFGMLVTFHGLMATAAALYLNIAYPHPLRHLSSSFMAFVGVWLLTTSVCLTAMMWVKWGDLGSSESNNINEIEEEHVTTLIGSVVTRTSLFRSAVLLTIGGIVLLGVAVWTTDGRTPTGLNEKLLATIGPFTSGVGCSTHQSLKDGIDEAVAKIDKGKLTRIRIVGSGDAVPIAKNLAKDFGNNAGLALTRARCVAGWLTDALGAANIHVEMEMTVQDAAERSSNARKDGADGDRVVRVSSIDEPQ